LEPNWLRRWRNPTARRELQHHDHQKSIEEQAEESEVEDVLQRRMVDEVITSQRVAVEVHAAGLITTTLRGSVIARMTKKEKEEMRPQAWRG
jgi:hypothetical protein